MARVKTVKPHGSGDGDFRRIVLIRDEDLAETESFSNAVVVIANDEDVPQDTNLTAVIERRSGDDRAVIRLSGTAGLEPVEVAQPARDPRTQQLRSALLDVPGVTGVAVVATVSRRARNIVIYWEPGADRAAVGQGAWRAVAGVFPDFQMLSAFWQQPRNARSRPPGAGQRPEALGNRSSRRKRLPAIRNPQQASPAALAPAEQEKANQ